MLTLSPPSSSEWCSVGPAEQKRLCHTTLEDDGEFWYCACLCVHFPVHPPVPTAHSHGHQPRRQIRMCAPGLGCKEHCLSLLFFFCKPNTSVSNTLHPPGLAENLMCPVLGTYPISRCQESHWSQCDPETVGQSLLPSNSAPPSEIGSVPGSHREFADRQPAAHRIYSLSAFDVRDPHRQLPCESI